MHIVFCDDDPRALELLQKYVREFFKGLSGKQPEFSAFNSGDKLLEEDPDTDIAFLDVEMPGISGIHICARLKKKNPKVKIFIVTAYPNYLDEAMREQVFRFLPKPLEKERLFRNLKDAVYQYSIETKKIAVETADKLLLIPADKIVCAETEQRKSVLYTVDRAIKTREGIDHWEKTLNLPCFYSPYRGYVINMWYVTEIDRDSIILEYADKEKKVYLARRRYADFKKTYLLYLESLR